MSNISGSMVLEILGKPAENVASAMHELVAKLEKEKGIVVLEKNFNDPIPIENSPDLFTSFVEITLEFEKIENLFGILFAYMPSHVELTTPEKLALTNSNLNELANALLQRLHNYDAIAKRVLVEREFLLTKIKELSPDTYKKLISPENKKESSNSQKSKI